MRRPSDENCVVKLLSQTARSGSFGFPRRSLSILVRPSAHWRVEGMMEALPARNSGNSCYANTVLQLVRTCDHVVERLLRHQCRLQGGGRTGSGQADSCMLCQLRDDFSMTEPRVPSTCQHLSRYDALGVSFSAGEQEDAHEFLKQLT